MYTPFRHIPSLLNKKAVQLTFFLTQRCNAKCPYCFYLQNTNSQTDKQGKQIQNASPAELQLGEIEKISASMGDLLWLAFSGGEIFLRRDLVAISEAFYRNNRPVYMLYPTNGQTPDRIFEYIQSIASHCPNSNIIVKLSLDGLFEQHDQLRQTPGSFAKTMETYRQLSSLCGTYKNLQLGVNTVFCSDNQDQMEEISRFVQSLEFINTHTVSLVRGNLIQDTFKQVDLNKYLSVVDRLAERIRQKQSPHYGFAGGQIKIAQDILQRKLISRTMQQQRRLTACYAGRTNLVLSENGEVYPCEILNNSMGNIKDFDYDMKKLIQSQAATTVAFSVKHGSCFCSHECHMMTNILANPACYFSLAKEYLKLKVA